MVTIPINMRSKVDEKEIEIQNTEFMEGRKGNSFIEYIFGANTKIPN